MMKSRSTWLLLLSARYSSANLFVQSPDEFQSPLLVSCKFKHYTAIGDSFAAGIMADPNGQLPTCDGTNAPICTTKACAKNTGSYPWLLSQKLSNSYFDFFACSNTTLAGCQSSQVPKVNASTDLITISIGADDSGVLTSAVNDCIYNPGPDVGRCDEALSSAGEGIRDLVDTLPSLVSALKSRASRAHIVFLSYPTPWPSGTVNLTKCQSDTLSQAVQVQMSWMNDLVATLNNVIKSVATDAKATFIEVNPLFEGHRLCDVGPTYIQWDQNARPDKADVGAIGVADPSLTNNGVFHPFKIGQEQYLQAISQHFKC